MRDLARRAFISVPIPDSIADGLDLAALVLRRLVLLADRAV